MIFLIANLRHSFLFLSRAQEYIIACRLSFGINLPFFLPNPGKRCTKNVESETSKILASVYYETQSLAHLTFTISYQIKSMKTI